MLTNMLIGQSGGPTVAINASLAGAIKRAMKHPEIQQIYGALNGLEGVVKEKIIDLRKDLHSVEDFDKLESTPAMALGSCRFRLADEPDAVYKKIREVFLKYSIGYFFYIGGNDSMDTLKKLSNYFKAMGDDIKCVGIPKTIDNDLACTDHTPGFGSAAKYIATSIAEIACDSVVYNMKSVTIVEIMGRNAGWLTAASVLARREGCAAPHLIYLPEVSFEPEAFLQKLKELAKTTRNIIVAVSEGVRLPNGSYVATAKSGSVDAFGHRYLAGVGAFLQELVRTRIGCKVRAVELNVLQRSAAHLYSGADLGEACRIGAEAVSSAVRGKTGVMAVFNRVSNHPYLVNYGVSDIENVANLEKTVPREWISDDGCDVTAEMIEYLRPLVQGETKEFTKDGIPVFFAFDKTLVKL
ncbi:MAG: 6-phosphofructokinase [Hydrogenoanaerobacterium sp.]